MAANTPTPSPSPSLFVPWAFALGCVLGATLFAGCWQQPVPAPFVAVSHALAWDAPTRNANGTPCTDLDHYVLYDGPVSGVYRRSTPCGLDARTETGPLPRGEFFFAVTAIDKSGNESAKSGELRLVVE